MCVCGGGGRWGTQSGLAALTQGLASAAALTQGTARAGLPAPLSAEAGAPDAPGGPGAGGAAVGASRPTFQREVSRPQAQLSSPREEADNVDTPIHAKVSTRRAQPNALASSLEDRERQEMRRGGEGRGGEGRGGAADKPLG